MNVSPQTELGGASCSTVLWSGESVKFIVFSDVIELQTGETAIVYRSFRRADPPKTE